MNIYIYIAMYVNGFILLYPLLRFLIARYGIGAHARICVVVVLVLVMVMLIVVIFVFFFIVVL